MSFGVVVRRWSAVVLLLGAVGCTRKPADDDYFPLAAGRTWTYGVAQDPADKGDLPMTLTVTSLGLQDVGGTRVTKEKIDLADETHYLFLGADEKGVYRFATQSPDDDAPAIEPERDYFLVNPLAVGKSWRGKSAPTFLDVADVAVDIDSTVESSTATVHVPAGEFTGCVEVHVTGKARIEPSNDEDDGEVDEARPTQDDPDVAPDPDEDQDQDQDPDDVPDDADEGGTFTLDEHTWYAPGVGVVKSVIAESFVADSGDQEKAQVTTELRSFKR
jgi:hypothetical protein